MRVLSCKEILDYVNGTLIFGDSDEVVKGVSTDTRKINDGDLFIPLVGANFDGHDFIEEAFEKGARISLTEKRITTGKRGTLIKVDNTLNAYGKLASFYRKKFDIPVIAVTGSVGKTSTKDMIACALSSKLNVLKTEANHNNEIGLPETLLKLENSHEAAVVEMGMRGFGEIAYLSRIAAPDIAVITNIGTAHIERLGSMENILKAKMEILEGLRYNGLIVLNGDDELLYGEKEKIKYRTVYFGTNENADFRAFNIRDAGEAGTYFSIIFNNEKYEIYVPVPGRHNVYNALAAFAVGCEVGLSPDDLIEGISRFSPGNMRMNILNKGSIKLINDTYNSNPQSLRAALKVLADISKGRRSIAVLGDMLELGRFSKIYHKSIGKYAAELGIDTVVTIGSSAYSIAEGAIEGGLPKEKVISFDTNKSATAFLNNYLRQGDVVLVKGSRSMKLEEVVEGIKG